MRKVILFLILVSPIFLFGQQPYKFQKIVYRPDSTYEIYLFAKDVSPYRKGVYEIVEKRSDSAGSIFYKEHFSVPDLGADALDRINKDGTVFESLYYRSG